jgi:hypothetical protein
MPARPTQSALSQPVSLGSILVLRFHLRLDLPSGLLLSFYRHKIIHGFLMRATQLPHPMLRDLITVILIDGEYKLRTFSVCYLIHVQAFSSALLLNLVPACTAQRAALWVM